ncbi:MAG: hypothetical protein GY793_07170 [Proteobacteria bacterium]|nr:hypothetical protein [Pseudomonadota bacterium]
MPAILTSAAEIICTLTSYPAYSFSIKCYDEKTLNNLEIDVMIDTCKDLIKIERNDCSSNQKDIFTMFLAYKKGAIVIKEKNSQTKGSNNQEFLETKALINDAELFIENLAVIITKSQHSCPLKEFVDELIGRPEVSIITKDGNPTFYGLAIN